MTELITGEALQRAIDQRTAAAIAYEMAMQQAAEAPSTSSTAGELHRLRAISEVADLRCEKIRELHAEQAEVAKKRVQREQDCAAEVAGLRAELTATRAMLAKRMLAAQSALCSALDAAREYDAAVARASAQLTEMGLGQVPGEPATAPLGRAGVQLDGQRFPAVDPAAVGHVIASRTATAALGQRNALTMTLGPGNLAVAALARSGLLDGVPLPKSTAPPPPVLPTRATLPPAPVVVLDRTGRSVVRHTAA